MLGKGQDGGVAVHTDPIQGMGDPRRHLVVSWIWVVKMSLVACVPVTEKGSLGHPPFRPVPWGSRPVNSSHGSVGCLQK